MVGGAGAIDGLAAIFPKTLVRLYGLVKDGEWAEARRVQEVVARGEGLVVSGGVVGVKEMVGRCLGWEGAKVCRLPLVGGMRDEEWGKWEGAVEELMEIERRGGVES